MENKLKSIKIWLDKFYKDELLKIGLDLVGSSLFIGMFTIGFFYYRFEIDGEVNEQKTLDILSNESLWIYSVIVCVIFVFLHGKGFGPRCVTKFLAKRALDYFAGLVFVFIGCIAVIDIEIPFIKLDNYFVFITFFESIIFTLLCLSVFVLMRKEDPKRKCTLISLVLVALLFLFLSIILSYCI